MSKVKVNESGTFGAPRTPLKVTMQKGLDEGEPIDTDGARAIRFTLPTGEWFEVEVGTRDGVNGVMVRSSDCFGVKLHVSNALWLIPRDGKV